MSRRLADKPSILIVEKRALKPRARGLVLTMTSGNHAVAAFPLLDGRFWRLSTLASARRSEVMANQVLCANVVNDTIETSQRDVSTADLVRHDDWLRTTVGFSLADVVMGERNEMTLDHYRKQGQEWRVKPLAWTEAEMRAALGAARKRMMSTISYFHSARGVHLLTYPEFVRFAALADGQLESFAQGLRELVGVCEGTRSPSRALSSIAATTRSSSSG